MSFVWEEEEIESGEGVPFNMGCAAGWKEEEWGNVTRESWGGGMSARILHTQNAIMSGVFITYAYV